jgi:hypothetical protein
VTPEAMDALTLADLEAIASRFDGAVRTIREAQSLLGGSPTPAAHAGVAVTFHPTPSLAPSQVRWTAAEDAERQRLKRINTEELPPAMRAAEEGDA